jgi:hypothetical protein
MADDDAAALDVGPIIDGYVERVRRELDERVLAWPMDVTKQQSREVLGGLLARQVSLATNLARSPSTWNGHIAPLVLRSMTDVYITMAWIWADPETRAAMYVVYGLGQLKLQLEHLKAQVQADGGDPSTDPLVTSFEQALNAERLTAFTEVNIGSWSGTDTRKMAEEAGCLDLYRFAYQPFSRATHSMWPHISGYNLKPCINPLHRMHRVPDDWDPPLDADFLYRAAKYVHKSMRLFDRKTGVVVSAESSFRWVAQGLTTPEESSDDSLFTQSRSDAEESDPTTESSG